MGLFSAIAGPLIGGAISAAGSFFGSREQNVANIGISQAQMDFQERMSSTAYQRSMKDMRKAGLNPILAYKTGGASSPGGAGIPAVDEIGPAVSSARAATLALADIKLKKKTGALAEAQTSSAHALRIKLLNEGQRAQYEAEASRVQTQVDILQNLARKKFLESKAGSIAFKAGLYGRAVNPLVQPVQALRR